MPDNQHFVHLLLDFDKAISWPDISSVTTKALAFFDSRFKLERISITLIDQKHQFFEVFTRDTSVTGLSIGDKYPLSEFHNPPGSNNNEPKYHTSISTIPKPTSTITALVESGIQSFFNAPLILGDEAVGSINIGSRQPDGIPVETQEKVVLLTARLSLALFHARLHDELKEKETALKISEKNYRELIDQAADVILKGNFQGDIIQANVAATRLLGYSNQELLAMNFSDLFEADILVKKPLRYDLVEAGHTVLSERVFRTKSGVHIPVEMNSKKLSDGTLVSMIRDLSERNKTKERLQDQKNQIIALFDATPTLMYAKDPEGRYTMLNDAYLKFFGKKREDMLGKKVTEIWHTPSSRRVEKEDLRLLRENKLQSHATEFKNAAGVTRQMLARKALYLDTKGNPAGFVGTLMDYTDLKSAQKRYETLFNNSPDPIVVHDGKVILTANQAALDFFKANDPAKYVKTPISSVIHPDSIRESKKRIKALFDSKESNKIVSQKFIIATGEVRDVEVMSVPIEDQGRVIIMSSFRDVTEDLITRKALLNSEERYRRAFNHSPMPMLVHDQGVLLDANQAALDFAGAKSLDEVLGIDLFTLVHPDFREANREAVEQLLKTGKPAPGVREQIYLTLSGEERWVEIKGVPVKQKDKTVILLSFNDIHEKVAAREQMEKSRHQLEVITGHLTSYLFLVAPDLSLLYINNATAKLLNIRSEDVLGRPLKEIVPMEDLAFGLEYLPRLLKGEVCSFQRHFTSHSQGDLVYVLTLIPIEAEDGNVVSILVQMDDVTEIESAREEIAENKELLELIVDTIPGLFSYSDMNEKYLYVNEAYANWYGYKKADVIGKSFNQIIPADIYSEIQPYLSRVSTGEALTYSRTTAGPEGRAHDLDIRYIPHFDTNKQPKAFLTSLQDVTERNEYELFRDSLRRLARQLTVSLNPREVGVIAAALLHELFSYDAFSLYRINLDENQAIGLFAQDTFVGDNKPVEVETQVNSLNLKNSVATFILSTPKLVNRKKDSGRPIAAPFGDPTRRSMSLVFVPIFWEGIQIGSFTLQSYTMNHFKDDDLQKLKVFANQIGGALIRAQADELIQQQTLELKARELELENSVKEKDVLLKEVYHRTKNNMQVIVGLLEMRGLKTQHGETQILVDEITNQIYSMSMVHDLLYRSKSLSEIQLDTYLEKLVDRLILAYKTSLGEITPECTPAKITVNIETAIPLGLVVNEIVSNALKYAFPDHRDGKIIIKTKPLGKDGLTIEVGDNGVGIKTGVDLGNSETFGVKIIRDIIELQLSGTLKISTAKGIKYIITIPSLKLD